MSKASENDLIACLNSAWTTFVDGLEKSLQILNETLTEAEQISVEIPGEWADDLEPVIDDLAKSIFSISEPRCADEAYSRKLRLLRHRLHDYYARFASLKNAARVTDNLPTKAIAHDP